MFQKLTKNLYLTVCVCVLTRFTSLHFFATLWIVPHQALLSVRSFRQEYLRGLPGLLPGDLTDPGINPVSLMSPVPAGGFLTTSITWEAPQKRHRSCSLVTKLGSTFLRPYGLELGNNVQVLFSKLRRML